MSSLLRSCEEDEGTAVNSEGGDFDEEEEDDGDLDENASDINSPAAPRETAARAAPGTVQSARAGHENTSKQTRITLKLRHLRDCMLHHGCSEAVRNCACFIYPGAFRQRVA